MRVSKLGNPTDMKMHNSKGRNALYVKTTGPSLRVGLSFPPPIGARAREILWYSLN